MEGLLDGVADTPEKQRAYLSTIQTKTVEMDQMVSKLFLFSKMDMGEYPYSPEVLDPLRRPGISWRPPGRNTGAGGWTFGWTPCPGAPISWPTPTYFRSILMNLLDNSAKYRHRERGMSPLTGGRDGTDFLLWVDDDGPGVPEEALSKLFDVFYRDDPARKKRPTRAAVLGWPLWPRAWSGWAAPFMRRTCLRGGLRMALRIPLAEEAGG